MAKKKRQEEPQAQLKPCVIKSAQINDDFCNYSYEIQSGVGVGDVHAVKGKGIIDEDMRIAFFPLNAHLACIDDVFKHSKIEVDNIDNFHNDPLTGLYNVTGFKIKGGNDNESVVLVGNKFVNSAGGRIELETPQIPLDNLSSYQWYNELKTALDNARNEVELYKDGKCTPVDNKEKVDPNQMTIGDEIPSMDMEEGRV